MLGMPRILQGMSVDRRGVLRHGRLPGQRLLAEAGPAPPLLAAEGMGLLAADVAVAAGSLDFGIMAV